VFASFVHVSGREGRETRGRGRDAFGRREVVGENSTSRIAAESRAVYVSRFRVEPIPTHRIYVVRFWRNVSTGCKPGVEERVEGGSRESFTSCKPGGGEQVEGDIGELFSHAASRERKNR
jgi:hypothetical protein